MPRVSRKRSVTGVYHVMMRGNNKAIIFHDDKDRKKFIYVLTDVIKKTGVRIHGYCLMDNHIHILIEEDVNESVGQVIKRISVRFVIWYNNKYGRTGHLFQGRFNSEAVEDEAYFKTVLRYIHYNPVMAGMVTEALGYRWSSAMAHETAYRSEYTWVTTDMVQTIWPNLMLYESFMRIAPEEYCLEEKVDEKQSFEELRCGISSRFPIDDLMHMDVKKRYDMIKRIKQEEKLTVRGLASVLKISKSTIERALKS